MRDGVGRERKKKGGVGGEGNEKAKTSWRARSRAF